MQNLLLNLRNDFVFTFEFLLLFYLMRNDIGVEL